MRTPARRRGDSHRQRGQARVAAQRGSLQKPRSIFSRAVALRPPSAACATVAAKRCVAATRASVEPRHISAKTAAEAREAAVRAVSAREAVTLSACAVRRRARDAPQRSDARGRRGVPRVKERGACVCEEEIDMCPFITPLLICSPDATVCPFATYCHAAPYMLPQARAAPSRHAAQCRVREQNTPRCCHMLYHHRTQQRARHLDANAAPKRCACVTRRGYALCRVSGSQDLRHCNASGAMEVIIRSLEERLSL